MSNEFVTALSASVNAGALILNDYLLEISDIEGGHRLTVKRGSDVQTMDIMDGGGSAAAQVQADWNQSDAAALDYVKNRPCYYEAVGDTIHWNGELPETGVVELPLTSNGETTMIPYCRIAEGVPTPEQMYNSPITVTFSDGTVMRSEETLMDSSIIFDDGFAMLASLYVLVVPWNNYSMAGDGEVLIFPERGVYVASINGIYPASVHIAGFEFGKIRQLDARFIPGYAATYANKISWNGVIGEREVVKPAPDASQFWVHVCDEAVQPESLLANGFEVNIYVAQNQGAVAETIPPEEAAGFMAQLSEDVYTLGEYFALIAMKDNAAFTLETTEIVLPKRGVYYIYMADETGSGPYAYMCALASDGMQVRSGAVLQDAYLPDTVQRVGGDVILNSSTEGSSKRFMLKVDDAGTITATEIT